MNGVILCVGRLKEKWQQQGCEEYLKRLSRYGKYEVVAVANPFLFPSSLPPSPQQFPQRRERDPLPLLGPLGR